MKKLIYFFAGLGFVFGNISSAQAQSFVTYSGSSDTVTGVVQGITDPITVANGIRSSSASTPVYLKWTILSVAKPSGVSIQFCDNIACRDTSLSVPGASFVSFAYTNNNPGFGDFHAQFNHMATAPANSVARITILAQDTVSGTSRTLTFRVFKFGTGVTNVIASSDDVTLYPNPAREAVNVLYSPNSGIKTIAVYNLIGRVVKVFRPMDDNSAKLDIDNIPTGVYFVRLMDADGRVVATRRFTRQ